MGQDGADLLRVDAQAHPEARHGPEAELILRFGRVSFSLPGNGSGMSPLKRLWTSVQGDPVFMRRVNGWLAVFWIAMIPVSVMLGWLHSVVYVSALSLWALVSGHWSAWQAARVEVEQERELAVERHHPVEERVVEHIIERTELEASGRKSETNAPDPGAG